MAAQRADRLTVPALLLVGLAACLPLSAGEKPATRPLKPEERKDFYHLAEGSEIFPMAWALALESSKTGKPFFEDLERFGLLPDPDGPEEKGFPGGKFPVGVTVAVPRGLTVRMFGVNCAACHVSEFRLGDAKPVRVDGAPNLVDMAGLYGELVNSFIDTLKSPKRLVAFLKKLKEGGAADRASELLVSLLPAVERSGLKDGPEAQLVRLLRDLLEDGPAEGGEAAASSVRALLKRAAGATPADLVAEQLKRIRERAEERLDELKGQAELVKKLGVDKVLLLKGRLAQLRRLRTLHDAGGRGPANGPGRVDAFGSARNLLFDSKDALPPDAPVRMPRLYGLAKNEWLHWDGNTNSVMERNIGQSLGLGAVVAPGTDASTLLPVNLHRLEQLAKTLETPAWPAAFGKVDESSDGYKRGKTLYDTHCASCHDRQEGGKTVKGAVVYDKVGTDPKRAANFGRAMVDASLGKTFPEAIAKRMRAIKRKALADYKDAIEKELSEEERKKIDLPDEEIVWQAPGGYVARPLGGIWAAAPYLHNGSVPTLDDLLKPAKDRPMIFPVGHREYDPVRVGFVSEFANVPEAQRGRVFLFDTRIEGNWNAGHEYPKTPLGREDRAALVTYLKTVR